MSTSEFETERIPHRWSRDEYERMAEAGVFEPDERLELIDGEVWQTPPQSPRHFTAIRLVERALSRVFANGFDVRTQGPLAIDSHSEPEPDIAVVEGSARDYATAHPRTAVFVVEVADSSLGFDRIAKKRLYARNGIPEYWILNLGAECLKAYRDPADEDYLAQQTIGRTEVIAPRAAVEFEIAVADLLP